MHIVMNLCRIVDLRSQNSAQIFVSAGAVIKFENVDLNLASRLRRSKLTWFVQFRNYFL